MLILVTVIIALGIIVAIASKVGGNAGDAPVRATPTCSTCNGGDSRCERDCAMEAATQPAEYFDDEELDAFRGRQSSDYTDDETEQFADVLYTMRRDEVAAWCRSLTLRGIQVPDQLKDEVVMMIDDNKQ